MAVLRAAFFARVQRLHAFGKRLGCKARPCIPYGEHRTARAVRGAPHAAFQRYRPALRRVARGILHKIHQRTQQLRPAHGQHGRSIRQQAKYTAPRPAESLALGLYLGQELRQGDPLRLLRSGMLLRAVRRSGLRVFYRIRTVRTRSQRPQRGNVFPRVARIAQNGIHIRALGVA